MNTKKTYFHTGPNLKTKAGAQMDRIVFVAAGFANKINTYLFITLILTLFFVEGNLNFNEEGYLAFAKQFYEPGWIYNSSTFTEFASTRVLYQWIAGFLLSHFSFEVTVALGRFLLCILLAWPLSRIYKQFQFNNIEILLHLPLLYFTDQSFFAGEFIFLSFEPKGFAYFFIFFALHFGLKERYFLATLFAILASYFHILVGGWFMFYFCVYCLFWERSFRTAAAIGLTYALSLLPMVFFLLPTLRESMIAADTPVSADWIFSYFKMPHHLGIFSSMSYFISTHVDGVLVALTFFLLSLFSFRKYENELNKKITLFNVVIFSGVFFWLIVAFFDGKGALVKYFPFRINAIFAFLAFLQMVFVIKHFFSRRENYKFLQFSVLIWFLLAPGLKNAYRLYIEASHWFLSPPANTAYEQLTNYIENNTEKDDVLFLISKKSLSYDYSMFDIGSPGFIYFDMELSIMRRTRRERFVSYFFAPVSPIRDELYDWYIRIQEKIRVLESPQYLCGIKEKYRIDIVITDFPLESVSCLHLKYRNEGYYLYTIE